MKSLIIILFHAVVVFSANPEFRKQQSKTGPSCNPSDAAKNAANWNRCPLGQDYNAWYGLTNEALDYYDAAKKCESFGAKLVSASDATRVGFGVPHLGNFPTIFTPKLFPLFPHFFPYIFSLNFSHFFPHSPQFKMHFPRANSGLHCPVWLFSLTKWFAHLVIDLCSIWCPVSQKQVQIGKNKVLVSMIKIQKHVNIQHQLSMNQYFILLSIRLVQNISMSRNTTK